MNIIWVFLTGVLEIMLYLNVNDHSLGLLVVGGVLVVDIRDVLAQLLGPLNPRPSLGLLQPGLEGDLEVHDGQEWVDSVLLLDDVVEDALVVQVGFALVLDGQGHQVDLVLSSKLDDLHLLVDLHVSVSPPHAAVEHLVEVDVSVVTLDGHLEQLLLQLSVIVLFLAESKLVVLFSQESEEPCELVFFDFEALVAILCQLLPDLHEGHLVTLEPGEHVVVG